MGVAVGWRTVGCPAGVTDSDVGIWQRVVGDLGDEVVELARLLASF